jgi:hypothetical protein
VYAYAYHQNIVNNVVVGGGITAHANGSGGTVRGNTIVGPAAIGIYCPSGDAEAVVTGNTVRDATDGIFITMGVADNNVVEDCSGTAFRSPRGSVLSNVVRRCRGYGIEISNSYGNCAGNYIDSVGLCGIHVFGEGGGAVVRANTVHHSASHGIWVESGDRAVAGNSVLNAGGDGIRAHGAVDFNIVGRSVGAGIVAASARHNTSYLNGAAGIEVAAGDFGTALITHNIVYGNGGPGLLWSGMATPMLSCNDWFSNEGGAVSGTGPGATDMSLEPGFCSLSEDDVHLSAGSPLLDLEGCGLSGALGQGCEGGPTGTLLALFDATGGEAGVLLRWQFGVPASVRVAVVERAEAETGPWTVLGLETRQDGGIVEALDTGAVPGQRYWYRLAVTLADLPDMFFGPVVAELPGRVAVSGVSRVQPNPSRGETRIEYTVAHQEAVRLSVVDVAGREVEVLAQGSMAPGRYTVVWDGRRSGCPVAAGLYFVRWQSPGHEASRPMVRLR